MSDYWNKKPINFLNTLPLTSFSEYRSRLKCRELDYKHKDYVAIVLENLFSPETPTMVLSINVCDLLLAHNGYTTLINFVDFFST